MFAVRFLNENLQSNFTKYFKIEYNEWGFNYLNRSFAFIDSYKMELCTLEHFDDIT